LRQWRQEGFFMAGKSNTKSPDPSFNPSLRNTQQSILWIVLSGAWLLIAAALISYDMADWPGHAVAPYNAQPHNWVGRFGAWFAHELYLMIGPGVWITMAGILAFLIATTRGKKTTEPLLRFAGLIIMSLTASCLVGMIVPSGLSGAFPDFIRVMAMRPEGVGGLVAIYVNTELSARFGGLGTFIIVSVVFWIGAILAMDQIVLAIPRLMGKAVILAGKSRLHSASTRFGRKNEALATAGSGRNLFLGAGWLRDKIGKTTAENHAHPLDPPTATAEMIDGELDEEPADRLGDDLAEHEPTAAGDDENQPFVDREAILAKIKKLPINFAVKSATHPAGAKPPREIDLSGYQFPSLDLLV
jgi:hypothetical protein